MVLRHRLGEFARGFCRNYFAASNPKPLIWIAHARCIVHVKFMYSNRRLQPTVPTIRYAFVGAASLLTVSQQYLHSAMRLQVLLAY